MQGNRTARMIDTPKGQTSPLNYAISQGDQQTMAMVRQAIEHRRLRLAWQPVVVAADPEKIGFHEGLMRVLDPTGRVIPARDFMAAVEQHEIGREIDCAALEMGLLALQQNPGLRLSINMSARSIGYPRWMRTLRRGLNKLPSVGHRLILEIAESSAMFAPEIVIAFMEEMQDDGISFALDGFGAGHTAIRYFRDFFFDILKIDGQFIRNISNNGDNQVLTAALIAIGRHFEMFIVAESVETVADAEYLRSIGVDCMQGYLFGAPTVSPAWLQGGARKAG